jgi:uncharacterized damage-inducible protein DinB
VRFIYAVNTRQNKMIETNKPFTKEELLSAFERVNKEVATFFSELPNEKFYEHSADVWSARDNLVHLNKSVAPVVTALSLPKLLLLVSFGKAKRQSRSFEEIRETYQGKLKDGAKATGRFVPDEKSGKEKEELLKKWQKISDKLIAALNKWSEEDLDKYRLPHPILGKLTVREMLFFTLYHNTHHVNNVRKLLS